MSDTRLIAYTNADFTRKLEFTNPATGQAIDLTGSTHVMQVRKTPEDSGVVLECSTTNSRIATTNAATGRYQISVSKAVMAAIAPGTYVYDYVVTQGGTATRMFGGDFVVAQGVTR